ncbi:MAG: hypothetical protein U1E43_05775 [Rhodospirillales bacterium]
MFGATSRTRKARQGSSKAKCASAGAVSISALATKHEPAADGESSPDADATYLSCQSAGGFGNYQTYVPGPVAVLAAGGLLAVAGLIPRDRYEVILTDENIEEVDFDMQADGISAMTSYVKRGYAIADAFRRRGIPVIMGGVTPASCPTRRCSTPMLVVIGEVEFLMGRILDDLEDGTLKGTYKADRLHSMADMAIPRYDLIAEALHQSHLHPDLARLPPRLHLLRRTADVRPALPLSAGRRGDARDRRGRPEEHRAQ